MTDMLYGHGVIEIFVKLFTLEHFLRTDPYDQVGVALVSETPELVDANTGIVGSLVYREKGSFPDRNFSFPRSGYVFFVHSYSPLCSVMR